MKSRRNPYRPLSAKVRNQSKATWPIHVGGILFGQACGYLLGCAIAYAVMTGRDPSHNPDARAFFVDVPKHVWLHYDLPGENSVETSSQ